MTTQPQTAHSSSVTSGGQRWSRARATPLAWIVVIAALLAAPGVVEGQMIAPLGGQGHPPDVVEDTVTEVYTSVELVKLMEIQEDHYTFTAVINVMMSWHDPRSYALAWLQVRKMNESRTKQQSGKAGCLKELTDAASANRAANTSSENCKDALSVASESCSRFCFTYGAPDKNRDKDQLCCDGMWIPDITLRNLLATPEDRVVMDKIEFDEALFEGGIDSVDDFMVTRFTQVLATFSTRLKFRTYPFDSQSLRVLMHPTKEFNENIDEDGLFQISPSATFRTLDVDFSEGADRIGNVTGTDQDELAGWSIQNVSLTCADISLENETSSKGRQQAMPLYTQEQSFDAYDYFEERDPLAGVYYICSFAVKVKRLSATAVAISIVPTAFTALFAFIIFFTSPDNLDTRLGTEVTLFLALTAVQFVFHGTLPLTSYITNLDKFILLSYSLIIAIVIESLLVAYIASRFEHKEKKGGYTSFGTRKVANEGEGGTETPQGKGLRGFKDRLATDPHFAFRLACRIDIVAGILFFVLYSILAGLIFADML